MNLFEQGVFFIQVTPGFELLALRELKLKFPQLHKSFKKVTGGLEAELKLNEGFELNEHLKIPNKILLRLVEFKCRDLPKLFNKVKKMDMRFFNYGQEFTYHVSSFQSRLFDDRKIIKTLQDALNTSNQAYPPKKKVSLRLQQEKNWHLYCRFLHDTCTLSLDTSGERLGKRGYKANSGKAPLRENLASGLWLFMTYDIDVREKKVLDPFAGSGTFLIESSLFNTKVKSRSFSYQALLPINNSTELFDEQEQNQKLETYGIELDHEQYTCLEKNTHQLELNSRIFNQDNINIDEKLLNQIDLIISNPPYSNRVHGSLKFWELSFSAQRIGILMPPGKHPKLKGYQNLREIAFSHGGQDVVFRVFKKA